MFHSSTAQQRQGEAAPRPDMPPGTVLRERNGARTEPPPTNARPAAAGMGGRLRRRLIPLLVAVLAGAGAGYAFNVGGFLGLPPVRQAEGRLVLQGNIDVRQVNLGFKVDGRIDTVAVDEGDSVQAAQVLATLDLRYFEDELRMARARRDNQQAVLERFEHGSRPEEISEARAALAEREIALENARQVLRRRESLVQRGAVTREEYDNASAACREAEARCQTAREALRLAVIGPRREDIDASRAQLRAGEVAVAQAERRLADSRLIAPAAGIILTRAREAGAIVQPGEIVFTLTLTSPVWVRTYVSELDLGRVPPGAVVEVTTDGAAGRTYRGHVGFVSPTAEFTPKSVETLELRTRLVYRVRVVVEDPDGSLRQGMPVTVRLPLEQGAAAR